jgi:hypothetical protein
VLEILQKYEQELDMTHHNASGHSVALAHVTTTTGHVRMSPKAEVTEDVIIHMATWMDQAPECTLAEYPVPFRVAHVPDCPGFDMRFSAIKSTLYAELHHDRCGHSVTFAVAADESGDVYWRRLSDGRRPPLPWCAVELEAGLYGLMLYAPDEVAWFGDFERCVAWGWLHLVQTQGGFTGTGLAH